MEPSTYNVFADLLASFNLRRPGSKRSGSPPWAAILVGVSWYVADVLKALIPATGPRREGDGFVDLPPPGEADTQWLASRNGELWLMRPPAPPVSLPEERGGEPRTDIRDGWK